MFDNEEGNNEEGNSEDNDGGVQSSDSDYSVNAEVNNGVAPDSRSEIHVKSLFFIELPIRTRGDAALRPPLEGETHPQKFAPYSSSLLRTIWK
jgi:hypothetical protein